MTRDGEAGAKWLSAWLGPAAFLLLAGVAYVWLDHAAMSRIADTPPDGTRPLVKVLSNFAEKEAIAFVILVAVALWGETRLGAAALMACGGGALVGSALKRLIGRIRPDAGFRSFPSTHAVAAFALAFVLARRFPRFKPVFYVGATLVALSRVLLRRHYPSDVLAGAALGLAAGLVGWLLAERIRDANAPAWPRVVASCLLVPLAFVLATHTGTLRVSFLVLGIAVLTLFALRVLTGKPNGLGICDVPEEPGAG